MGGGFVMNSSTEIEQAFDDYRTGAMGTLNASR
jgi:redox-sensitive bicupin YhaK (pirin superfamily)